MNPLMQYQVHDKVFVNLPSKGYYYTSDVIQSSANIGVRPMSAKEEMVSTNPDALMSGKSVDIILESCCSSVLNSEELLLVDTEVLMLAVKLATGEETYKIKTVCPKCSTEGEIERDMQEMIDNLTFLEKEYTFKLPNNLVLFLKPKTNKLYNDIQNQSFKMQKMIQALQNVEMDDDTRKEQLKGVLNDLVQLNLDTLCACIEYIDTPDGKVQNKEYISEFIETLDTKTIKKINTVLNDIDDLGVKRTVHVQCNNPDCLHEFDFTHLRFNPSDFFG